MTENKNMLKTKNNRADTKTVAKKRFYGIVEFTKKVRDAKGKETNVTKTVVIAMEDKMTRLAAKQEVEQKAKSIGGKLTYFGAFRNQ